MKKIMTRTFTAAALLLAANQAFAVEAPKRTECIAPAKPGGGFDLTCKLIQVSLQDTKAIDKPMRVTYMPGGVGAVAYNAIVAQRRRSSAPWWPSPAARCSICPVASSAAITWKT